MLADVTAGRHRIFLVFAVDDFFHAPDQKAGFVGPKQRIPIGTPDHLDHVPARARKDRFELLNDLAVAAHRPVETLQVAVDDPGKII